MFSGWDSGYYGFLCGVVSMSLKDEFEHDHNEWVENYQIDHQTLPDCEENGAYAYNWFINNKYLLNNEINEKTRSIAINLNIDVFGKSAEDILDEIDMKLHRSGVY